MALTKEKKKAVVDEVSQLLSGSKMTVVAKYAGTGVKDMQGLRRSAKTNGTTVKVIKNRLVIQAIKSSDKYKQLDTDWLNGMLLYAFNDHDEVDPAQSLHKFGITHQNLEFVGAISGEGEFLDAASVKALAVLPSKNQLIAGMINNLLSPLQQVQSSLSGNLSGLISGLEAKAKS